MMSLIERTLNDRYYILEQLGEGGSGIVYRGTDQLLERSVAIKILHTNRVDVQSFLQEMRTLARLEHPHILPVYDVGNQDVDDQPVLYMVMRLAEGQSLKQQVRAERLTEDRIVDIFFQLCDALRYIHGRGVLHLDIKPDNVLFDANQNVLLADFGIARLLTDTATDTKAETGIGTPAYMPPEQFFGNQVAAYSDIYALGAMFYHLLTGQLPERHLAQGHFDLQFPSEFPEKYRTLIKQATSSNPADRYTSVDAFQHALNQAIHADTTTSRPTSLETHKTRQTRRLDAAMPSETIAGQSTELWVQVCLPASEGFRPELPIKTGSQEEIKRSDVRDSTFPIDYERDRTGRLLPAKLRVAIHAPDFAVHEPVQDVILFPEYDSGRVIFTLTPVEEHRKSIIRVSVFRIFEDSSRITLGSVTLHTTIHAAGIQRILRSVWNMVTVSLSDLTPSSRHTDDDEFDDADWLWDLEEFDTGDFAEEELIAEGERDWISNSANDFSIGDFGDNEFGEKHPIDQGEADWLWDPGDDKDFDYEEFDECFDIPFDSAAENDINDTTEEDRKSGDFGGVFRRATPKATLSESEELDDILVETSNAEEDIAWLEDAETAGESVYDQEKPDTGQPEFADAQGIVFSKPPVWLSHSDQTAQFPASDEGVYLLLVFQAHAISLNAEQFGEWIFPQGWYVFAGHATNLRSDIERHLRRNTAPQEHVDYLLQTATVHEVWYTTDSMTDVHQWAQALATLPSATLPVPGASVSDCMCPSHLIHFPDQLKLDVFQDRIKLPVHVWIARKPI